MEYIKITEDSMKAVPINTPGESLQFYYRQLGCKCVAVIALPGNYCMIVDNEGVFDEDLESNTVASLLYGQPIFGTVLIGKYAEANEQGTNIITGLNSDETEDFLESLFCPRGNPDKGYI